MKILIIEDSEIKRNELIDFLTSICNIEFEFCEYLYDALRYIDDNENEISGIILDLGLQKAEDMPQTYGIYVGLDVVYELKRSKINIPVLINSTTFAGILDEYPFIFGQRMQMENYDMLEKFVTFLRQREEQ